MSRLDRLFLLLETGSSGVTRRAAAGQLGEVQRLHPHELHRLLDQLLSYLRSPSWDTRIAAGQAVDAILSNVPPWHPTSATTPREDGTEGAPVKRLTCDSFQLDTIISSSQYLMGSEGKEYDMHSAGGQRSVAEQCEQLNSKLGLEEAAKLGIDTSALYTPEDLKVEIKTESDTTNRKNVGDVVGLSCREANRAKRKARARQGGARGTRDKEEPESKRARPDASGGPPPDLPLPDNTGAWTQGAVDWPLDWFCSQLCSSLFSPVWETRHGAATGLRHLIKTHGAGGGRSATIPPHQMEEAHQGWLEDIALRIVCVLTLDRFGDFVCDQVVAPVRESCAQVLGSVVNLMEKDRVEKILKVLLQLLEQKDWETRHGGLLGIKYIFAVRQELVGELLPVWFELVHRCLGDGVEDVGAVAGGALATCVDLVVDAHPERAVQVLHTLCALIPQQDDLSPAASTFVPLLATLLLSPPIAARIQTEERVGELVRRLWSLLEHNNRSVRRSALQTLAALSREKALVELLQPTLRHVFQRALVEHHQPLAHTVQQVWWSLLEQSSLSDVLVAACPVITSWLCLAMQPTRLPFDQALLIQAKPLPKDSVSSKKGSGSGEEKSGHLELMKAYIGGTEVVSQEAREENALRARSMAARMLGFLSTFIVQPAPGIEYTSEMESPIDCYVKVLLVYLNSKSALQRLVVGLVIAEWARRSSDKPQPRLLIERILQCLSEINYYDEIALLYTKLLQDTKDFVALLKHYKLPTDESSLPPQILTLDQMEMCCGDNITEMLSRAKLKPKIVETLMERRKTIHTSISSTLSDQNKLNTMTQAALAGALVMMGNLPEKPGPVVKPLMDSIKREDNEELQALAADHLAHLVEMCLEKSPSPNGKILTNLCNYLQSDPEFTPRIPDPVAKEPLENITNRGTAPPRPSQILNQNEIYTGIITLINQRKTAERAVLRRCSSTGGRGPGRPPITDIPLEEILGIEDQGQKMRRVQRRGATLALKAISRRFAARLPHDLPLLWDSIVGTLTEKINPATYDQYVQSTNKSEAQTLVGLLQVLEITCSALDPSLIPQVVSCTGALLCLLHHPYQAVRHMSSRAMAALALVDSLTVMTAVIDHVVPMLSAADSVTKRQGAVECIAIILDALQFDIVPYILFLVIPLLGRMSDQESSVRMLATHTFANLIQLMPLDGVASSPPDMSARLAELKERQRVFLQQLFNPTSIPDYQIPVPIQAQLRSYQQSGVNWLAFLNKYKLHGILCDDMGLGKTLQSICIVASDHHYREQKYKETKQDDCVPIPSLVVCPPSLTGHWVFEVEKFLSNRYLRPLHYTGNPMEREKLKSKVKKHNLIIASYDAVRKDVDFFSSIKWNYCILDEGHVIKNGKTLASKAIKQLCANQRLILSGTPIQNNVLELWSLFDFLMPGFLGTEKQFNARYSKPILASRDPKSSPKEQEAGVLAMEALHRQVLPFVLRRMKEDVLKDLPPKITQDYYCELSPLQEQLYEDFAKSQAHQSLTETVQSDKSHNASHIFQALRYLQSVCNHPKLALTPKHPQFEKVNKLLHAMNSSLSDIQHAAKLPALKQLLLDCGIGVDRSYKSEDMVVNQHRALIFCQLKAMLDIVEQDLFRAQMPGVSYLRLDGSVPPAQRHSVVTAFNMDPSIDVLLLTTQVGGLGLNLTGADTVIFVEHDWSPMKDLQAMDRAHRIGQKKVVNVYRLITRNTLEEKIMGLQKFKLRTAQTVISTENASIETMGTDKLLDLFTLDGGGPPSSGASSSGRPDTASASILKSLPELWEHTDYEEEYDLTNFINNLKS